MLNGCSCSGKSTIVKRVMVEKENFYQLSSDPQKWLFSKYDKNNHFDDLRKIMKSLAETVCEMNYNIICDSALRKENREELLEIGRKHGYEIIEINLEASYEVLEKRFDERVEKALSTPNAKISNTSKDRFKELYEIYNDQKNPQAITFNTETQNVDEVVESIFKLI